MRLLASSLEWINFKVQCSMLSIGLGWLGVRQELVPVSEPQFSQRLATVVCGPLRSTSKCHTWQATVGGLSAIENAPLSVCRTHHISCSTVASNGTAIAARLAEAASTSNN